MEKTKSKVFITNQLLKAKFANGGDEGENFFCGAGGQKCEKCPKSRELPLLEPIWTL